jgi:hypothetical protein
LSDLFIEECEVIIYLHRLCTPKDIKIVNTSQTNYIFPFILNKNGYVNQFNVLHMYKVYSTHVKFLAVELISRL